MITPNLKTRIVLLHVLTVSILNDILEKTGFVSYKVETNAAPVNGVCDFMPKNGSSSIERNFTCSNWTDDVPGAILSYKVLYSSCDMKQPSLLYYGPQSQLSGLRLPPAPDQCNHTFKLFINVEDAFKAYASNVFNITVCSYDFLIY